MTASLCHPVFDLIGADDFAAFDGVCIDRHQLERFAALRHTHEVARWGLIRIYETLGAASATILPPVYLSTCAVRFFIR
jgi:hypothetical protein